MNFTISCGSVESWLASPYAEVELVVRRAGVWYANETFHALVNDGTNLRMSTIGGVPMIRRTPRANDEFGPAA